MSPADSGKSTAVTRARSTGYPITPRPAGGYLSGRVGTSAAAVDTGARLPLPAASTRVKPPLRLDPHQYNDPSNYLG